MSSSEHGFTDKVEAKAADKNKPFGFKNVSALEKPSLVQSVFSSVAKSYDIMNDIMSMGVHRYWKSEFVKLVQPFPGMKMIDMAGGTGDISFRVLDEAKQFNPPVSITLCDYNQDMLTEGRRKAINQGRLENIDYVNCDAANLPFNDHSFDVYTISFGLRNVTEIEQGLREANRVLKPGGRFYCLEFSKVQSKTIEKLYDFYTFQIIPKMGGLIAKDKAAYQYLVESIARFPEQTILASMISEAGFDHVTWRNMTDGIVAIHSAQKKS